MIPALICEGMMAAVGLVSRPSLMRAHTLDALHGGEKPPDTATYIEHLTP
jgi:hypothetical protein